MSDETITDPGPSPGRISARHIPPRLTASRLR